MRKRPRLNFFKARSNTKGFTLIEVMMGGTILTIALCGLVLTYLQMFVLVDLMRDQALATNAAQGRMEEIKNTNFLNLSGTSGPFNLSAYGFPASQSSSGRVEVTENFSGYTGALTKIRVIASYRSRNRSIGEDVNFNGAMDTGEDTNGNGRIDSPVELVNLITP